MCISIYIYYNKHSETTTTGCTYECMYAGGIRLYTERLSSLHLRDLYIDTLTAVMHFVMINKYFFINLPNYETDRLKVSRFVLSNKLK